MEVGEDSEEIVTRVEAEGFSMEWNLMAKWKAESECK